MEIKGNLVDVVKGEIYPAKVTFNSTIEKIERTDEEYDKYILPGLIDAHIHIESSMLCPSRFGQVVVPHGTTAVVSDPHEIANVLGLDGIEYMREDASKTPLKIFYTAPSCVPATVFETAGAVLDAEKLEEIMKYDDIVALGEVMNFPGVIARDEAVMSKIELAKKYDKCIDGHAPLVTGDDLSKYISAGITTDHECVTTDEAIEKTQKGMKVMMRYGSASKSMEYLAKVVSDSWMIVSDDKHIDGLIEGHLNIAIKRAVELGLDPIDAVRAVSIIPANHYKLNSGAIEVGKKADIVKVDNLKDFNVTQVYLDGELVAENGKPLFDTTPLPLKSVESSFRVEPKDADDFKIKTDKTGQVKVRVIEVVENQIITKESEAELDVVDNEIIGDIENDILKIAVVERYGNNLIANAFIKGFSLKKGAIASSIAHDSHNIICVGTNSEDMAKVVNEVIENKGGLTAIVDGELSSLELPIAGLMSSEPAETVREKYKNLETKIEELGCGLECAFMTLSFMALLVIPELKLSDKGLFSGKEFKFVDVIK